MTYGDLVGLGVFAGCVALIAGCVTIAVMIRRRQQGPPPRRSGKGWELLVEEAQTQALTCLEQTNQAILAMRRSAELVQKLQLENARLQAELAQKDTQPQ